MTKKQFFNTIAEAYLNGNNHYGGVITKIREIHLSTEDTSNPHITINCSTKEKNGDVASTGIGLYPANATEFYIWSSGRCGTIKVADALPHVQHLFANPLSSLISIAKASATIRMKTTWIKNLESKMKTLKTDVEYWKAKFTVANHDLNVITGNVDDVADDLPF